MEASFWHEAVVAVDVLLRDAYRIDLEKVVNPLTKTGITQLMAQFSARLKRVAKPPTARVVRRALDTLDVDWPNLSVAARNRVFFAANRELAKMPLAVQPGVSRAFNVEAPKTVRAVKGAAKRTLKLDIGIAFDATDKKVVSYVARQANLITTQIGEVAADLGLTAREVVAEGLAEGLGRDAIAGEMERRIGAAALGRTASYWNVVAGQFMTSARSFGLVSSFRQARIKEYMWESVVDEVTTEQCRMMHGRVFRVGKAMERFNALSRMRRVETVVAAQPWMFVTPGKKGKKQFYIKNEDGSRRILGTIQEGGIGQADEIGRYTGVPSSASLESLGISTPPLHGLCRSTILPV